MLHKLRNEQSFIKDLSYVAVSAGEIIGSIACAKVFKNGIICEDVFGFGPLSVIPKMQGNGIGSRLIEQVIKKASDFGFKAVIITGDFDYYKRFGFQVASDYGIHLLGVPIEDKAEFFMVKELEAGFLEKNKGTYSFDKAYETSDFELEEFEKHFPYKQKRESRIDDLV